MDKLDITAIILTYNEELHIQRCIANAFKFCKEVIIIDSYSSDNTVKIAKSMGANILQNKWENNQAKQFNWGLDNADIKTKWILRLDADEFLTSELIDELYQRLPSESEDVTGIEFKRRVYFLGKWIKKGTYPVILLRLFKKGIGRSENRLMDEHIIVSEGKVVLYNNDFVDYNLNDFGWWCNKHIGYSIREAAEILNIEYSFEKKTNITLKGHAMKKRKSKENYVKKTLFFRAFLYFMYRYFLQGGFLEGKEGFIWNFFQGWWYRTLVDVRIFEIKRKCHYNKNEINNYLKEKYCISFDQQF